MKKRGRKPKCPYCKSSRTISKGSRKTQTMGNRPLRVCRDCKRKFTVNRINPALAIRKKAPASQVALAS